MLGLRSVLKYILPELPEWLAAEIARAEHCRREMQCKGPSPRATPPSPVSSTSMSHEQSTPDMFDKTEHITRYLKIMVWVYHQHDFHEYFSSHDLEDNVFERMTPSSPQRFDEPPHRDSFSRFHRSSRGSADQEISYRVRDDGTPDSPISQVRLMVFFNLFLFHQLVWWTYKCSEIFPFLLSFTTWLLFVNVFYYLFSNNNQFMKIFLQINSFSITTQNTCNENYKL